MNKSQAWHDVAKSLQIKDDKSAASFLKKQYIKCLFAFECKFNQSIDFGAGDPSLGPPVGPIGPVKQERRGPGEMGEGQAPAAKRQATGTNVSATLP